MELVHNEYSFASATGVADVYAQSWEPADPSAVKGVFQMVHGMAEYSDRYTEMAKYIASDGWAVFLHDHVGHGKSVNKDDDLGYFGEEGGDREIVDDTKSVTDIARKKYPGLPVVLYGHSMGSFVVRSYAAKYGSILSGLIVCGTSGSNPGASVGIAIAKSVMKHKGSHYRSPFINKMAFGSYNKKFMHAKTGFEWLSANSENVAKYCADPLCGFLFTAAGYRDMFLLLKGVSGSDWYTHVPKTLPIFLISGDMDPVGNFGKGVTEVFEKLKDTGHSVDIKLYKGFRHEIHNETGKAEVYSDIVKWADSKI